jgi:hypothetical protein
VLSHISISIIYTNFANSKLGFDLLDRFFGCFGFVDYLAAAIETAVIANGVCLAFLTTTRTVNQVY